MSHPALIALLLQSAAVLSQISAQSPQFIQPSEPFRIESGSQFEASGFSRNSKSRIRIIASDIAEAEALLRANHASSKPLPADTFTNHAIRGALRTLDPHSKFFPRNEWREFLQEENSSYSGIGATIGEYSRGGTAAAYIVATVPGGPAHRGGLHFGDKITAVDGVSTQGMDSLEVRNALRGENGTSVKVTVEAAAGTATRDVIIVRRTLSQPSIPDHYMLAGGTGYIGLTDGFHYTTTKELDRSMQQLKSAGMSSLILDLRGNGGGIVDQAVKVVEKFLAKGSLILSQRGRSEADKRTWYSSNPRPETMPLVVLVDQNTASASEIVAGALQDHDRALVVGSRTFGKGLVQSVIEMPSGRGLTLTSARYFTPSGRSIQRDYTAIGLYDYFRHAEKVAIVADAYAETTTSKGRRVTSGDGILPDEQVAQTRHTNRQLRFIDPIFFFLRFAAAGDVSLKNSQQQNSSAIVAFAAYVARNPEFELSEADVFAESAYITQRIRYMTTLASAGFEAAARVSAETDPQLLRGLKSLSAAADLLRQPSAKSARK